MTSSNPNQKQTSIRNVVILGGRGGSLTPFVLDALVKEGTFNITIVTRKSSSTTTTTNTTTAQSSSSHASNDTKIHTHTIDDDYPPSDLQTAFRGQDAVISLISPQACTIQYRIIDAAVLSGVKYFIPAEFGYDVSNPNAVALLPALQLRADIVAYLQAKEEMGMSWTAFATGPFLDWGIGNGFMGFDIRKREGEVWDKGDVRFSCCTRDLIAEAVVRTLVLVGGLEEKGVRMRNRRVYIQSFVTSQNEILDVLRRCTGGSGGEWTVQKVRSEEMIRKAREMLDGGVGDVREASNWLISAIQYTEGNGSDFSGREANEVLSLMREDLEGVVRRVLEEAG